MTDTPKPSAGKGRTQRDLRAEALQKALRDNLRRRKAAAAPAVTDPADDHEKAREKDGGDA